MVRRGQIVLKMIKQLEKTFFLGLKIRVDAPAV